MTIDMMLVLALVIFALLMGGLAVSIREFNRLEDPSVRKDLALVRVPARSHSRGARRARP